MDHLKHLFAQIGLLTMVEWLAQVEQNQTSSLHELHHPHPWMNYAWFLHPDFLHHILNHLMSLPHEQCVIGWIIQTKHSLQDKDFSKRVTNAQFVQRYNDLIHEFVPKPKLFKTHDTREQVRLKKIESFVQERLWNELQPILSSESVSEQKRSVCNDKEFKDDADSEDKSKDNIENTETISYSTFSDVLIQISRLENQLLKDLYLDRFSDIVSGNPDECVSEENMILTIAGKLNATAIRILATFVIIDQEKVIITEDLDKIKRWINITVHWWFILRDVDIKIKRMENKLLKLKHPQLQIVAKKIQSQSIIELKSQQSQLFDKFKQHLIDYLQFLKFQLNFLDSIHRSHNSLSNCIRDSFHWIISEVISETKRRRRKKLKLLQIIKYQNDKHDDYYRKYHFGNLNEGDFERNVKVSHAS